MKKFFLIILFLGASLQAFGAYKVRIVGNEAGHRIVSIQKGRGSERLVQPKLLQSLPYLFPEGAPPSKEVYQEYLFADRHMSPRLLQIAEMFDSASWEGSEVRTLILQGPTENRINLTIVGDGYRLSEKEKFFVDAQKTADSLFKGHTFASYLPLFNIFAVFVPSQESGVGDGSPKNTALKLYRSPKGSKRAIMPGDESAAERALALAPATDYPILIANDNYYGGLGGRFAISTSSERSGMIVLRHELGHNFGNVGEEYDGGYVYSGANSSRTPNAPWGYWSSRGQVELQEAFQLAGEYVWKNLASRPYIFDFNFPKPSSAGPYRLQMIVSTVGWETPNDVSFFIDNDKLPPFPGEYHDDRNFYNVGPVADFAAGKHTVTVQENVKDGDNVLAFVMVYALGANYNTSKGHIGAYMTYDISGNRSYRPTHDTCLMRNMMSPDFCVVDQENMWHQFLNRVELVDEVRVNGDREVQLKTPPLKGAQVTWYKLDAGQEVLLGDLTGKYKWQADPDQHGKFKVQVKFLTPEVRKYSTRFVTEKTFDL